MGGAGGGSLLITHSIYRLDSHSSICRCETGKCAEDREKDSCEDGCPEIHLEVGFKDAVGCVAEFKHLEYDNSEQDAAHSCDCR